MNRLAWRWRRWRAAHYVWLAENTYRQNPNDITRRTADRAWALLDAHDAGRP